MSTPDWKKVQATVDHEWDATIIPALSRYIEVPNQSPAYDPEFATNGFTKQALQVMLDWVVAQQVGGLRYELIEEDGRTPFLFIEIAGSTPATEGTVLMYGHMDKQPPLRPWAEGLDPTKAVVRDGKLFGRGGADDGYALFAAVSSVAALQRHNIPHGRVVVIIESGEESGSPDLAYYMQRMKTAIGDVRLIFCLDSGCMNYEQVWLTTSLRGVAIGSLSVRVLREGMHSGVAGGVVPDSFRIARQLLDRVEDPVTGEVEVPEAHGAIADAVVEAAEVMRSVAYKAQFSTLPGVETEPGDNVELALRNAWKPSLTVVGANLPEPATAGNVIRAETVMRLSFRIPPTVDAAAALQAIKKVLEADPPYNAKVHFTCENSGNGCRTPELQPWLVKALNEGSELAYGQPFACQGMGGAIPFIAMLIDTYPAAQVLVTGVLGPNSNAHGPNEFLHIEYTKGITLATARVVAESYKHASAAA